MLQYLTGLPERTGYALAGGTRQPMGTTIIALLRSAEGGRVLDYIMAGSKAPWWRRHIEDRRDGGLFREAIEKRQLTLPLE
ncbi:MAG: hypothetical protein GEU91_18645 [Rhizobiales bacterium]|nr:hypothetical protein [Hyphomicrobiales bacterium]